MTAAGLACGSCGAGLRENAKFCDQCGVPTAASGGPAKYKQVTVLFADVVRSTDIAAAVELERLREIITAMVERSAAVARHYGGTVEYNGDGVMALFGAPASLEDHAFRGCLAALAIQDEANRLAAEVQRRDGVTLRLRVGLNSGQVIAGEIGSGSLGYAATGEAVGFAQRMESAAPPGGVMVSESTAQLVEHTVVLAEPEWVRIKGAQAPVRARQLLAIQPQQGAVGRADVSLVGRRWEMATIEAVLDRAIDGRGGAVGLMGPPGIGKSRVAREAATLATARGADVFWAFCESHARDISFGAITRMLRAVTGVVDLDAATARARLREYVPDADPQDQLLLDDLLGVADPDEPLPQIDPEARRRRLSALIKTATLSRAKPALYVIEDAHWIDAVSEAMLADFLTVVPRTPLTVLITSRPDYAGALAKIPGMQSISLVPLGDSDITALLGELLGSDPSVSELAAVIADRAAGNPFFAEEMARELEQRGVLSGERGRFTCGADAAEVSVPATVQAAIAARIDRLSTPARQTLSAASVIGVRFRADVLAALGFDPVLDELLASELIDQMRFIPSAEYAFRHALIRAVAYESQLKSDRAEWHRRVAAAIEESEPESVDENATLIAEHLQAAGELHAAYGWHMRAAGWLTNLDLVAARTSWQRASRVADQLAELSDGKPDQLLLSMRIAPRTMLCATEWRSAAANLDSFDELRELCAVADDKLSLAIGMTGLTAELCYAGRSREGARLSSEQTVLLESISDPAPAVGLAFVAFCNWCDAGDFVELLRWSQTVVEMADGDPAIGAGFGIGSPLAAALAWRGVAKWWLGRPGWRQDLDDAGSMARRINDPVTIAGIVAWTYGLAVQYGVFRADDSALNAVEEAARIAANNSNDAILVLAEYTLAVTLLNRSAPADRQRGVELMTRAHDIWLRDGVLFLVPITDLWVAREQAKRGDRDAVLPLMRQVVADLQQDARLGYGVWATGVLVATLLERGTEVDLTEAEEVIGRLANLRVGQDMAILEITLLRLHALLARARGDDGGFRDFAGRYRAMAKSLGFEGHTDWAEAMM